jgi:hypothetical protein
MTKDLPIYKITIDPEYSGGEELGIEQIAFTSNPAIKVKGMAFSQEVKMLFADDLKYRVTAPAMIPMEIYRRDDETGEYYVQFTAETIEQIHAKFMQDLKNRDIFNLEHDQSQQVPAYILESWIVDNPKEDKAFSTFGIEVPKGTLMITAQVTDKDYYSELVKADQVGFSIEGFLGLKLSNHLKLNNMKLPDGEHLIEGKIYVVKGGEIIEIKDVPNESEVAMEDTVVEEDVTTETEPIDEQPAPSELEEVKEEIKEEVKEEKMAVDVATDAEAVLAIVAPVLEEQVNNLLKIIADLKSQMEEMLAEKAEDEIELKSEVKMSIAEKFSALNKLSNN